MSFIIGTNDPAPTIITQPRAMEVVAGMTATLSVTAAGADPLSYQWRKNGTTITGAATNTYSIPNVQASHAGTYSVVITNPYGSVTSSDAVLSVITTVPLNYALNNSNVTWTTDTTYFWFGQTNSSHDGVAAARTVPLPDDQSTSLRGVVAGPGTLSFWWKVSSQPDKDLLKFRYGTTDYAQISGESGWQPMTVYLPSGNQQLQWSYSKDGSISAGDDIAWVDQVVYTSGPTKPFITQQPQSQSSLGGSPVAFSVSANGTPTLSYQWYFNGGKIDGATSPGYYLASPGSKNNGTYYVEVSSPYGSVVSDTVILGVVPMAVLGDNSFGQINVSAKATNAVGIAAGSWHHLALTAEGEVLAWGNNSDGQCSVPDGLGGLVGIAAGGYHSLALKSNRTVASWGANWYGQSTPPAGLTNVVAVSAGAWHSLALRMDGSVIGWGDNSWGQINTPPGLGKVIAISAGGNHTLALRQDGTVAAWGEDTDANGFYAGQSDPPWGLNGVAAISAGEYHSLALLTNGTVTAWGDNSYDQCGVPADLTNVVAIAAGGSHSVALKADGSVVGWGANWNGQCNFPSTASVLQIAAGAANTLLLIGTPAQLPTLLNPRRAGGTFSVTVVAVAGKYYALEYKNSMATPAWNTNLPAIFGNGTYQMLVDPAASTPQRFYRVRQW